MPCVSWRLWLIDQVNVLKDIHLSVCLLYRLFQMNATVRMTVDSEMTVTTLLFYMWRRKCRLKTVFRTSSVVMVEQYADFICNFSEVEKYTDNIIVASPFLIVTLCLWTRKQVAVVKLDTPKSRQTWSGWKFSVIEARTAGLCSCIVQKLLGQCNLWFPPWLMSLLPEPLVCRWCDQGSIIHSTAMKRAEVVSHVKSLLWEKTLTHAEEFDMVCCLFEDSTPVLMLTLSRVSLARFCQYRCAATLWVPVPSSCSNPFRKWWQHRWFFIIHVLL